MSGTTTNYSKLLLLLFFLKVQNCWQLAIVGSLFHISHSLYYWRQLTSAVWSRDPALGLFLSGRCGSMLVLEALVAFLQIVIPQHKSSNNERLTLFTEWHRLGSFPAILAAIIQIGSWQKKQKGQTVNHRGQTLNATLQLTSLELILSV